jgi:hypothetical protein
MADWLVRHASPDSVINRAPELHPANGAEQGAVHLCTSPKAGDGRGALPLPESHESRGDSFAVPQRSRVPLVLAQRLKRHPNRNDPPMLGGAGGKEAPYAGCWIWRRTARRFPQRTGNTCHGQVVSGCGTICRPGDDVVDVKGRPHSSVRSTKRGRKTLIATSETTRPVDQAAAATSPVLRSSVA